MHKAARSLVQSYDVIALERLRVQSMTRSARGTRDNPGTNVRAKSGLNRAILDAGFAMLRLMIVAKAEEAGRQIIEVDPRYTSQTCAVCGQRDKANRRREYFKCARCGNADDADINAAKMILMRAQSALKSGLEPDEESGSNATHC